MVYVDGHLNSTPINGYRVLDVLPLNRAPPYIDYGS